MQHVCALVQVQYVSFSLVLIEGPPGPQTRSSLNPAGAYASGATVMIAFMSPLVKHDLTCSH